MDEPVSVIQSFIIKLWLEETGEQKQTVRWRGRITHVPSGEKRYLHSLDDVISFIRPYLNAAEIEAGGGSAFERLLTRLRARFKR